MTRQRPSLPPRGLSHISSSSDASFHSAHENRRSMYPGMQARVSDAEQSEPTRRSNRQLSGILERDQDDEESNSPIRPPRRNAGMHGSMSDVSESDSGHGSRVERSHPSQASLSDYSLDPRDSISNRDSSPSDNGDILRYRSPRSSSDTHSVSVEDEYYDHRFRTNVRVIRPAEPGTRRDDRAISRSQDYSLSSSDSYSEEPRTSRGSGMRSRRAEYDDECDEPSTPRGYRGRRMNSRYDDYDAREDAYEDELRNEYRRNEEGYDYYIIVPPRHF